MNVPGRRIIIFGTSGAGKTTMARQLAERLGWLHVELDALHWEPGWAPAETEVFRERVRQATSLEQWVLDGNYGKVRDVVWGTADTLVWLDYSLAVILWRLWWRTLRRIFLREELWNGNRETFRSQFFSRDSLFLYTLKTHNRRRQRLLKDLERPEYAHLRLVRLRSPREAAAWFRSVTES